MWIKQQIKHYKALNEWFKSPLGLFVAQEFSDQLNTFRDYLNGDTLLQLGSYGDNPWLTKVNFTKKWIASPCVLNNTVHLECPFNQIPLARHSLDCIVAPMPFESFSHQFSILEEIDRVLKPMGFIVLLSVNPWSVWGIAMKLGLLKGYSTYPIKMHMPFIINRFFVQRGYRHCALSNFCYIPPINNESLIKKLSFLEEVGKMLWPLPSGFYCYVAQKYEYISPSLLIKPLNMGDSPLIAEAS